MYNPALFYSLSFGLSCFRCQNDFTLKRNTFKFGSLKDQKWMPQSILRYIQKFCSLYLQFLRKWKFTADLHTKLQFYLSISSNCINPEYWSYCLYLIYFSIQKFTKLYEVMWIAKMFDIFWEEKIIIFLQEKFVCHNI